MKIGYARVSTLDQHPDLQQDALEEAGCEELSIDRVSDNRATDSGLQKIKEQLRAGDTSVIWSFDWLGRSLKDLIEWVVWLEAKGVALQSLKEMIDTTTSTSKLVSREQGSTQQD